MNILNKEELRRQIREGKEISLDGILDEFKSLLRESLQTASEEELIMKNIRTLIIQIIVMDIIKNR